MSDSPPPPELPSSTRDALLDAFIVSLHPTTPKHCAEFYISCTLLFRPSLPVIRVARPDVLETALRFLTHPRTPKDLESLGSKLSECHCDATSKYFHRPKEQGGDFFELFGEISFLLAMCFTDLQISRHPIPLDTNRHLAKRARKQGWSAPWPDQPSDLFVYPPEQMLAALWNLFRVSEDYKILFFLHNITSVAGSTFTSQFHTLPSFPQEYMFHFKRAFTSGVVATPRFVTLRLLTGFLSAIWYRIGDNTAQFAMWYPHAHHMIVLFSTAIATLVDNHPEPNEEELIDALSGLGAQFILQFGSTIELDYSQYAPQIRREADVVTLECHNVFVIAWAYLRGFAQSDRCQAPGCVETFSKQNRRFNRCSGCGIMPYCSKSCQAAAWRHPRVPHKILCQELKSYTRKLAGVSWTQCPQPCAQEVRNRCAKGGVTYFEALALGLRAVSLYDAACDGALKDLPNGMKDVFEGDVIDFLLGKGLN